MNTTRNSYTCFTIPYAIHSDRNMCHPVHMLISIPLMFLPIQIGIYYFSTGNNGQTDTTKPLFNIVFVSHMLPNQHTSQWSIQMRGHCFNAWHAPPIVPHSVRVLGHSASPTHTRHSDICKHTRTVTTYSRTDRRSRRARTCSPRTMCGCQEHAGLLHSALQQKHGHE